MESFLEYEEVRIVCLLSAERWNGGTDGVRRPPHVGDIGTIVDIGSDDPDEPYWVENDDDDGYTIWLAVFSADELEHA